MEEEKILIDKGFLEYVIGYLCGLHSINPQDKNLLSIIDTLNDSIKKQSKKD